MPQKNLVLRKRMIWFALLGILLLIFLDFRNVQREDESRYIPYVSIEDTDFYYLYAYDKQTDQVIPVVKEAVGTFSANGSVIYYMTEDFSLYQADLVSGIHGQIGVYEEVYRTNQSKYYDGYLYVNCWEGPAGSTVDNYLGRISIRTGEFEYLDDRHAGLFTSFSICDGFLYTLYHQDAGREEEGIRDKYVCRRNIKTNVRESYPLHELLSKLPSEITAHITDPEFQISEDYLYFGLTEGEEGERRLHLYGMELETLFSGRPDPMELELPGCNAFGYPSVSFYHEYERMSSYYQFRGQDIFYYDQEGILCRSRAGEPKKLQTYPETKLPDRERKEKTCAPVYLIWQDGILIYQYETVGEKEGKRTNTLFIR